MPIPERTQSPSIHSRAKSIYLVDAGFHPFLKYSISK